MIFKNIKDGIIANIVDKNLIEKYKKDKNFICVNDINVKDNSYNTNGFQIENTTDNRKLSIKIKLSKISEDIIQSQVGELVPNIEEKKKQFVKLHNELRVLEGKEKRKLINNN